MALRIVGVCIFSALTACNKQPQSPSISQTEQAQKTSLQETLILKDDFSQRKSNWQVINGQWSFEKGILKQSGTKEAYPEILYKNLAIADVKVAVSFTPISGNIDASGGIIFRAKDEDNYYIVRANALEDNFRLYTFIDGRRHLLKSATVKPPSFAKAHSIRIIAVGNHIQAYLNDKLKIDITDDTFKKGITGLWTKEDSVTTFDDFRVYSLK